MMPRPTACRLLPLLTAVAICAFIAACDRDDSPDQDRQPAAAVSPVPDDAIADPPEKAPDEDEDGEDGDTEDPPDEPPEQPDEDDDDPDEPASYYDNICEHAFATADEPGPTEQTPEVFATRTACRMAGQHRQYTPVRRDDPGPEIELTVVAVDDGETERFSHQFDSWNAIVNCMEYGYGDTLDEPQPLDEEQCGAPDEMAPLVLAHRSSMVPDVDSCTDSCCSFDDGPPVHRGLKAHQICYETDDDQKPYEVTSITLERTDANPELRAERQRQTTLQFAWHFRQPQLEQLRPLLRDDGDIDVDVFITSAIADKEYDDSISVDAGELIEGLSDDDATLNPADAYEALAGPGRQAPLGVTSCVDDCCELAGNVTQHNQLVLQAVCFDHPDGEEPKIESLDMKWQW